MFDAITDNNEEIGLEDNDKSAAIIHGTWNTTNLKKWSKCTIMIDASTPNGQNRGIYVTVNKLNLRKISGSCQDYIQFISSDNKKSTRICGEYEATGNYTSDRTKSFTDNNGHIKMNIELNEHAALSVDQQFEVVVVFTAFRKGLILFVFTILLKNYMFFCL